MPHPIYAQSLFGLLKATGMEQKTIAARLDVWDSAVSSWALGKTPVPRVHQRRLLDLVHEVLDREITREGKDSPRDLELNGYVRGWYEEMFQYTQRFTTELNEHLDTLCALRGMDVLAIPVAERDKYFLALMHLDRLFGYLRRRGQPAEVWGYGHDTVASFDRLRQYYEEESGGRNGD